VRAIPKSSPLAPVRRQVCEFQSALSQRAILSSEPGLSHEQYCARELRRAPEPCDALQSSDARLLGEAQLNAPGQPHAREPHDEQSLLHATSSLHETGRSVIPEHEQDCPRATLLCHESSLHGTALLREMPLLAHAQLAMSSPQRVESLGAPKRLWLPLCGPAAWRQPGLQDGHCWLSRTTLDLPVLRQHAAADSW
jgi:hypothetical protein